MSRRCYFLAIALALLPHLALAQGAGRGEIHGRIFDSETGDPLEFVDVSARGADLQGLRQTVTLSDGSFQLPALPIGSYTVELSHTGYQSSRLQDVIVTLDGTAYLGEIKLMRSAAGMETIEVVAERRLDPRSIDSSSRLTAKDLEALPTERDFRSTLAYLPHANASFHGDGVNISGSTGSENVWLVEGMNVSDPHMSLTGMQIPSNFIREIEVKSGGFQAEYGRSTGGVINVITRSGSNEFHGDVFAYYSNNNLGSDGKRGLLDLNQDGFDRYDVGLSLGGPIVRDRLWFFAAYDPSIERESLQIPGIGFRDDERTVHQFAGKLSWMADENTRFDFSAIGDPTSHDRVSPNFFSNTPQTVANEDVLLGRLTQGGFSLSLDGTRTFGHRFLLEGDVSRYDSRIKNQAATERGAREPMYLDYTTGEWSGGYNNVTDHHMIRTAGRLVGTAFIPSHEIKLGVEYENNFTDAVWQWKTEDGGDGLIMRGAGGWTTSLFDQDIEVTNRVPSFFIQDSWQAHRRLMLHAGLRWDGLWIVDAEGEAQQSIKDQYQPRIGFTFQPGELGDQKIFGSYGRFYEQFPTFASAWYSPYTHWFVNTTTDPRTDPMAAANGDSLDRSSAGLQEIDGLKGQYFDEFTLGYEQLFDGGLRLALRGMHRTMREIIEDSFLLDGSNHFGNPGRGEMAFLPDPVRKYTALELTAERRFTDRGFAAASYVLSRSYGNYTGVFNTDTGVANPNSGSAFNDPEELVNAEGKLPNDRTHVLKLYGSHRFDFGLTTGAFFTWQSGTPLSELAFGQNGFRRLFLTERGTAGRAPAIWDLNVRLAYPLTALQGSSGRIVPRVVMDIFHLFSQEEAVTFDQVKYLAVDADRNGTTANPSYLQPTSFQPPMTIRMGVEARF